MRTHGTAKTREPVADHDERNSPIAARVTSLSHRGTKMQMQIDTHQGDPAEDRGAFIGGVLGCLVILGLLLVAHMLL